MKSFDQLDARPHHKLLEGGLVREPDVDKRKQSTNCHKGGSEVGLVTCPELGREVLVMDKAEEVAVENSICVADFVMEENNTDDCAVEIIKELEDANCNLNFQTEECSSMGQLEMDKEFTVHDLCEVLNSSFGEDMDAESSKVGENNKNTGSTLDGNKLAASEHELQLKEMELEKLISNPHVVDSNICMAEDEVVEEGEISGDVGSADALLNELSEDAVHPRDKSTKLAHASDDNVNKQGLTCTDGERGHWRDDMPNLSIFNTSASDSCSRKAELIETVMQLQDTDSQNVLCDRDRMASRSSPVASSLEKLSPSGRNLTEKDAESQIATASIQDGDDVNKKKRKKGPLTKERKAKKKKKERIKRAEQNRKLGINRLKLPVSKPKTPQHCRHYLNGRCHEGANCKFSHDVVPLTKSKPCSYFARQSCMKGDDCPFDHVLSKYPCDNYATKGFCSRGSDCLFSHTIPANQISTTTPSISKKPLLNSQQHRVPENNGSHMKSDLLQPYIKLTSPLNKPSSSKNGSNHDVFNRRVDPKLPSGATSSDKKAEKLSEPVRTVKQTPKGVSFLLHGGSPLGDPSKQNRSGPSPNIGGGADANQKILNGPPDSSNKSIDMHVAEIPKKPRGINFLSFAQKPSLGDTSANTLSNLFSNVHSGKGKPGGAHLLVDKPSHLLPVSSGRSTEASKLTNQNAADQVQNSNGGSNNVPQARVPEPVNSRFPGKTQAYDSENPKISSSLRISPFSNTPGLVQKAVQSTLAFAARFEPNIKLEGSHKKGS